jgi:hypothetical protein
MVPSKKRANLPDCGFSTPHMPGALPSPTLKQADEQSVLPELPGLVADIPEIPEVPKEETRPAETSPHRQHEPVKLTFGQPLNIAYPVPPQVKPVELKPTPPQPQPQPVPEVTPEEKDAPTIVLTNDGKKERMNLVVVPRWGPVFWDSYDDIAEGLQHVNDEFSEYLDDPTIGELFIFVGSNRITPRRTKKVWSCSIAGEEFVVGG